MLIVHIAYEYQKEKVIKAENVVAEAIKILEYEKSILALMVGADDETTTISRKIAEVSITPESGLKTRNIYNIKNYGERASVILELIMNDLELSNKSTFGHDVSSAIYLQTFWDVATRGVQDGVRYVDIAGITIYEDFRVVKNGRDVGASFGSKIAHGKFMHKVGGVRWALRVQYLVYILFFSADTRPYRLFDSTYSIKLKDYTKGFTLENLLFTDSRANYIVAILLQSFDERGLLFVEDLTYNTVGGLMSPWTTEVTS